MILFDSKPMNLFDNEKLLNININKIKDNLYNL